MSVVTPVSGPRSLRDIAEGVVRIAGGEIAWIPHTRQVIQRVVTEHGRSAASDRRSASIDRADRTDSLELRDRGALTDV